jgi:phosphoglycerate dehydrogenase-like enzyme
MSGNAQPAVDLPRLATDDVVYLSTLQLPDATLAQFGGVSPRLHVIQQPCTTADEIPAELWQKIQVLHTSTALPDPSIAPRLAWVQLDTAGVDHVVRHPIWTQTAIPVTTIAGVSGRWTAEYVVMMILAASHRLPQMLELQRTRTWPTFAERWRRFLPADLHRATCTIVGFGQIGRAVGELCAALGMDVIGIRRTPAESGPGGWATVAGPDELPAALGRSDYVVVSVPLTPQTRMLLDRSAIEAIKPGAMLINVARGGIIDEEAVADALRSGRLSSAAMDVFADEPLPDSSPLWDVPGLIISPHVSGFAGDYVSQVSALVTENLRRYIDGQPLLNAASREAGY